MPACASPSACFTYGAWPGRCGQPDGRRCEVPAACSALAQPGFQGRGATQAIGDAGEDDGAIDGAEGRGEQGEAWGGGALVDSLASCLP